jgi:tetratricopeptide (TPR) repeat protein
VDAAARREAREQRQRRWAFGVAAALLVLLGVGALIHARSMAAARDRAEKALRAEAEAHAQVVDLLNFLLGDLREGLAPIGRLSLLERVADKAFEQLRKLPPGQMTDAALAQRARALETLGDVLAARGSETDAGIAWREALAIREGLVTRDPTDLGRQRELASSLLSVSRTVESEGNLAGALALARHAAEVRDRMATRPGADSVVLERARAAGRHRIADLLEISGDLPGALAEHRAALAIYQACLARAPEDVEARRDRAVARSRVGDLLAGLGDTRSALVEYRAYAAEIGALQARDPHHAELIRELAVAHNSVGWALRSLGDLRGALGELETQRDLAARLVERDPSNAAWRVDLAQARAAVGQVLVALGRHRAALAELQAGASEMERVAAADPANRGARRDAAIARGLVAKALLAMGRRPEAAEVLRGPIAVLEALTAADPGNATWQGDLGRLRAWQTQAGERPAGAAS